MKKVPFLFVIALNMMLSFVPAWAADAKPATTNMGRLFLTPSERASLNIIRQNSKAPDRIITAEETKKDTENELDVPVEPTKPVTLNGFVGRSDGKNTVWVNHQAMSEKTTTKNLAVGNLQKNNGQVQITVIGTEKKSAALKAGQVYDPNSKKVYNYTKDVPEVSVEEKPESGTDGISKKLGLDELKSKVVDIFSPLSALGNASTGKQ